MIGNLLRNFAEENFGDKDGSYFPVYHGKIEEIEPFALMVKQPARSIWERPFKKNRYTVLAGMETYVATDKKQEFLDAVNENIKKEDANVELQEEDEEDNEGTSSYLEFGARAANCVNVKIKINEDLGNLELGRIDQEYIRDSELRDILAKTKLNSAKCMEAFEGCKLRLITSVFYSEQFAFKRHKELQGHFKKSVIPTKMTTRHTRGPFLFNCCQVVYNIETNRLELVEGKVVGEKIGYRGETKEEEKKEEYENIAVDLEEDKQSDLADDDDDDDDYNSGDDDGDGGDEDDNEYDMGNVGSEDIPEEQELPQQFHGLQLGGQEEHLEQQDQYKTKIDEEIVTSEGTYWPLKQEAVHLMFPANAVSEPTTIVVHKWKCSACSPPLQDHEAIVSNVIEISTINGQTLEFNAEVKLFLSHSAPDLKGYEMVFKRQIDKECNEWEDVDGTQDLRSLSDIGGGCPSPNDIPDFFFPVAQAGITKCSTYTVVCRLKSSPPYTITSTGGYFSHPDYPGVTVTIPENAVAPEAKFSLQLKVQEVPNEEFEGQDVFLGPVLRIVRSQVHFLKPVTIQLPVSLRDEREGITDPLTCRVRVFFLRTDGEHKEWIEITDDLVNPASFDGTFVRFQVERFCRYCSVLDGRQGNSRGPEIRSHLSRYNRNSPLRAFFFAYFRPNVQGILLVICCPAHLRSKVMKELERKDITPSDVSSMKGMIPKYDKAFVFVSGGIRPYDTEDMEEFHLPFDSDSQTKAELRVQFDSDKDLAQVEFHSTPMPSRKNLLCKLHLIVPSLSVDRTASEEVARQPDAVKDGNPSYHELEGLSEKLPEHWEKLGRQLNFDDAKLKGYHKDNEEVANKIYAMLKAWKERDGSDATYRVLYQALCDISRKDLAQKVCCH